MNISPVRLYSNYADQKKQTSVNFGSMMKMEQIEPLVNKIVQLTKEYRLEEANNLWKEVVAKYPKSDKQGQLFIIAFLKQSGIAFFEGCGRKGQGTVWSDSIEKLFYDNLLRNIQTLKDIAGNMLTMKVPDGKPTKVVVDAAKDARGLLLEQIMK